MPAVIGERQLNDIIATAGISLRILISPLTVDGYPKLVFLSRLEYLYERYRV